MLFMLYLNLKRIKKIIFVSELRLENFKKDAKSRFSGTPSVVPTTFELGN
jgi:hypothetical protein